ncbi:MAG: hypothetical protein HPY80_06580 [Bacteroidales bacterium]|jgi:hypothetical protein|nr:hypothetical protein [Bacteroidales bacterium]NPV36316.1 hypothetical protein [Bacteroidales bacterium]
MKSTTQSILLWVAAFIIMLASATYQRLTGPTHPKRGQVEIDGQTIRFRLLRSQENNDNAKISIKVTDTAIHGIYKFKRLGVEEEWDGGILQRQGDELVGFLPKQPAAGKLEYRVTLSKNGQNYPLTDEPIVIRFKGTVPLYILIPHIFFMFFGMMFSMRTGLEALFKGARTYRYTLITLIFLIIGGMIFGPLVQKFAFGAFWTGWPFGHDLTDNKTLVAIIFWLIALLKLRRDPSNRLWPILASVVTLLVYLIPHSMFGSHYDYSSGEVKTGPRV